MQMTIGTIIKAAKDAGFVFAFTGHKGVGTGPSYVSHGPFTMDANGLRKEVMVRSGRNKQVEQVAVSGPLEILGRHRDPNGRGWGKQLRFGDADGRVHMLHVSDADLQGDPGTLCASLADKGLYINRTMQRELAEYLGGVDVDARVIVVGRTGWHEIGGRDVFVLPSEAIAAGVGDSIVLDASVTGPYETCGSLEDWKQVVGALTAGHPLLVFMVSTALAGPLAHLVGAEGGGFHVYGPSSLGKSSGLQAAASVWGRGGTPGYVRSWRATANGLEGAAASASDTFLALDELGVGEAREVGASIYALANGAGKARAARDGTLREPKSWRVSVLSTGEVPIEAKLDEDRGRKARAGQRVRMLDLHVDQGHGFGAFDSAGGFDNAGTLADVIKTAATTAYGTAGPEFVGRIIGQGIEKVVPSGKEFMATFVREVVPPAASEQILRAAKKFALVALAGDLATGLGVTPWAEGEARRAAIRAFESWLEKRGGAGSHEEQQAIEQVRLVIEQHGETRFEPIKGSTHDVRDRLGWRTGDGPTREWLVQPQSWKDEVCAGLDPVFVARTLDKHKMLRRQGGRKDLTCVFKIGGRSTRGYVLTAAILDSGP